MALKIKSILTAVIVLIFTTATAVKVYSENKDYKEITDEIFGYFTEKRGADSFFEGLEAGVSDWSAFCYARLYNTEGAEEYIGKMKSRAKELINSEGFVKPTDLQRTAIVLSAFKECPEELLSYAVYYNEDYDRQGFNAYVWGLIALNCAEEKEPEDAAHTKKELSEYIISKQLEDGGFSLFGNASDCDMTASAIYALAPLKDDPEIADALKRAENRLISLQLEDGGFSSMGTENCESAAQAIIALNSLGYKEDNENVSAAVENILEHYLGSGKFSHTKGESVNALSSVQALMAFTSLRLAEKGESLFGKYFEAPEVFTMEAVGNAGETISISGNVIKFILSAVFGIFALIFVVSFMVKKKKISGLSALILIFFSAGVWLLDIKSPDEYYSQAASEPESSVTVTVSAECSNALDAMDKIDEKINPVSVIPMDGVVIPVSETSVPEGSTAFDALCMAAKSEKIRVDYVGSVYGVYVNGIGYIYEQGFGSQSGWMYMVNGEFPRCSCGDFELSDGDDVRFVYTVSIDDKFQ